MDSTLEKQIHLLKTYALLMTLLPEKSATEK